MNTTHPHERKGELYAFSLSALEGFFPIFSIYTIQAYGAVTAYGYTIALSTLLFLLLQWRYGLLREMFDPAVHRDLLLTSLFIALLFLGIFIGLRYTTAANASVIMVLQLFFSYLYFNFFGQERMRALHLTGAALMGIGAIVVLLPQSWRFNPGDLIILASAAIAPLANYYQKRARARVSGLSVMSARNLIALPFLAVAAFAFESPVNPLEHPKALGFLLLNATLIFVLAKLLWVEALHYISVTKLSALAAFIPLWTLLFVYLIDGLIPSTQSLLGACAVVTGAMALTRRA
ncbi:MAG: DMT family transporter [Campylobacterales bacterium]|nr:DMT family transporter [Campylobacterales bacterium]